MSHANVVDQEFQYEIRFLVLQTLDSLDKLPIEEDGLLARDGVDPDNGMDAGHGIFTDQTPVRAGEADHLLRAVRRFQAVDHMLKSW